VLLLAKLAIALENISKFIQNHLKKQKNNEKPDLFFVKIRNDIVFINGIEIVCKNIASKEKAAQYAVLELLTDHYFNFYVKNCDLNETLSIHRMIELLDERYNITINHDVQIRRIIKIIRDNIFKKFNTEDVIETIPWKGYRFNPKNVKLG
jgi:hypothetical protein